MELAVLFLQIVAQVPPAPTLPVSGDVTIPKEYVTPVLVAVLAAVVYVYRMLNSIVARLIVIEITLEHIQRQAEQNARSDRTQEHREPTHV